jgi:hypothetical protein
MSKEKQHYIAGSGLIGEQEKYARFAITFGIAFEMLIFIFAISE